MSGVPPHKRLRTAASGVGDAAPARADPDEDDGQEVTARAVSAAGEEGGLSGGARGRQTASLSLQKSQQVAEVHLPRALPRAPPKAAAAAAAVPAAAVAAAARQAPAARRRDVALLREADEKRADAAAALAAKEDRLRCAATDFSLWRRPSSDAFAPAPLRYPGGPDQYLSVMEPLLFEEAREEVRSVWGAACSARALHGCRVVSLRPDGHGWHVAQLQPDSPALLADKRILHDAGLAVLSGGEPGGDPWRDFKAADDSDAAVAAAAHLEEGQLATEQRRGGGAAHQQQQHRPGASGCVHVAGFVLRVQALRPGEPPALYLRFFIPEDEPPDKRTLFFQPSDVLARLRELAGAGPWRLASCGKLGTSLAEFRALHATRALHPLLRGALLDPGSCGAPLPAYALEPPPPLSAELGLPRFMEHLSASFNDPQRMAIHWAASAVAAPPPEGAPPRWPFTLVQGPPGTGKTHTVWGMLNVLHLTAYQRYYKMLLAALTPRAAAAQEAHAQAAAVAAAAAASRALYGEEGGDGDEEGGGAGLGAGALNAALAALGGDLQRTLNSLAAKPRILVCAPSNAAVDVLLARCMEAQFVGGGGERYRPDVVRLASEDATITQRIAEVSISKRVDSLVDMHGQERAQWIAHHTSAAHAFQFRIGELRARADFAAAPPRSAASAPVEPGLLDRVLGELVHVSEQYDRTLVELSRLQVLLEADMQPAQRQGEARRQARMTLEASFVNEAELVFTTLGTAARTVFARLEHGFDVILIDEAAQATEISTLVPLRLGAKAVVLVGDPQQLPATVISDAARSGLFQRSLFERLSDCGAASLLLAVQYRMHPSIRRWPSAHFYGDRLVDSDSVLSQPDEPFYALQPLWPYAFLDCCGGREERGGGGGYSWMNRGEAALAAALYARFKASLPTGAAAGRVAFLTPYRAQLKALEDALKRRLGPDVMSEVTVNTVDGYQGRERDVVILSLVRSGDPRAQQPQGEPQGSSSGQLRGALGFVADIRRMNVALTRARRALWIVGNAQHLRAGEHWASLLQDAEQRGAVVSNACVATIFPAEVGRPEWPQDAGGRGGKPKHAAVSVDDPAAASRAAMATLPRFGGFGPAPPQQQRPPPVQPQFANRQLTAPPPPPPVQSGEQYGDLSADLGLPPPRGVPLPAAGRVDQGGIFTSTRGAPMVQAALVPAGGLFSSTAGGQQTGPSGGCFSSPSGAPLINYDLPDL